MTMLRQSADLAWRNMIRLRRSPASLTTSLVEPVLFACLLGFVFGGSLGGPAYREFVVAGLLMQTVTFSATFTTMGLAHDLQDGAIDRLRTLPIARVSLLLARTTSDLTACLLSVSVSTACGLVLGWRPRNGPLHVLGAYLMVVLFAFLMSWIGAFVALVTPNVQVAGSIGLLWLFPLTFVSSGFVSATSLPGPLATVATWNPVSGLANSLRVLFGNSAPPGFLAQHGWPAEHPVVYGTASALVLIAAFGALSTWRYRRRTAT
ncbi:ABC transporter permease [Kribbella sp. NPDC051587]|uniref:ABC transporter permease n=1 Tax=Kribbella sp. NPDC051587 TaxID=3364119 RepID=UPI00379832A0